MTKVALFVSAALLAGSAVAFAQSPQPAPSDTNAPSAQSSSSEQNSASNPANGTASQANPTNAPSAGANEPTRTAANPACDQDAARYCEGKTGSERESCLDQNSAKLSTACKQAMQNQLAPSQAQR